MRAPRESDAGEAAGDRQQQALLEHLPHYARLAGAERHADGDLALARRRARQQQVRQVGAGDEQHQQHRSAQNQQRRAQVAGDAPLQGGGENPHAVEEAGRLEILRVLGSNGRGQLRQLRLELFDR